MRCRLVEKVGERFYLRVYWGNRAHGKEYGYHNGMTAISDLLDPKANMPSREARNEADVDYWKGRWPTKCDECGAPAPPYRGPVPEWPRPDDKAVYQFFYKTLYGDPPHTLQPGDMFWSPFYHWTDEKGEVRCMYWDDCKDPRGHLVVVPPPAGPDPWYFDTDGRASNCNRPRDRAHRCWEKHYVPPDDLTIGGPSSDNGAGSILSPLGWHGFIRHGEFTSA